MEHSLRAEGRTSISPATYGLTLFEAPDPARARGASVTFEPGARTAWHTHPLGQTLIVTSGVVGRRARAAPKWKFDRATWSGARRMRGIGMARRRQPP